MVSESDVMESLGDVEDPEMKMSVTELGLIYAIRIEKQDEGTHAEIDMTLTSPDAQLPLRLCLQYIAQLLQPMELTAFMSISLSHPSGIQRFTPVKMPNSIWGYSRNF